MSVAPPGKKRTVLRRRPVMVHQPQIAAPVVDSKMRAAGDTDDEEVARYDVPERGPHLLEARDGEQDYCGGPGMCRKCDEEIGDGRSDRFSGRDSHGGICDIPNHVGAENEKEAQTETQQRPAFADDLADDRHIEIDEYSDGYRPPQAVMAHQPALAWTPDPQTNGSAAVVSDDEPLADKLKRLGVTRGMPGE